MGEDLLSSKTALIRPPNWWIGKFPKGDRSSASGSAVPRAGTTSTTNSYSLFDRVVQFIADGLNIGTAYKMYCLSSNLELLCKKPEEWEKDSTRSAALECLLRDCKDAPEFHSVLEKILAPLSESLLSQSYALAKKMQKNSSPEKSCRCSELLTAIANQGMEKAAKRIVSFYETGKDNKPSLHLVSHMLLTFMADCPGIEETEIENALINQFEVALVGIPKCVGSEKSADKSPPRSSASYLEETFQMKSNIFEIFAEHSDFGLSDEKKTDSQWTVKPEDLDEAKNLLAKARITAENRIKSNERSLQAGMGTEKTNPIKSDKAYLSKNILKKQLESCFDDYYKSIHAERFQSAGAEKVIRKLYSTLAALEENSLNPSHMSYFLRKIESHVKKNAVGREGDLLEKVQSEESGFKNENAKKKKISKFNSISTVVDFSKSSMNEFKTRQKTKNQLNSGFNFGNKAGVAGYENAKLIL